MVSIPAESDMFVFKKNPFVGTNLQKKKLSLNESGIVKNIHLDERDDGYGRYIVGDSIDEKTGGTGKFLIELKDYSVQEALLLVDHKVKFHLRSNGSKLKPLDCIRSIPILKFSIAKLSFTSYPNVKSAMNIPSSSKILATSFKN